jgi:hypothetical protein
MAGVLSADVTRHDRFGRDEDALNVREAKASLTDIGDVIRGIADAKPEVHRLPERPHYAL